MFILISLSQHFTFKESLSFDLEYLSSYLWILKQNLFHYSSFELLIAFSSLSTHNLFVTKYSCLEERSIFHSFDLIVVLKTLIFIFAFRIFIETWKAPALKRKPLLEETYSDLQSHAQFFQPYYHKNSF